MCLRFKKGFFEFFMLSSTSILLHTPGRTSLTQDCAWNKGGADNPIPQILFALEQAQEHNEHPYRPL